MTAKEYLKQISVLNERINNSLNHIDDLRQKATTMGLSSSLGTERVQSSGSSNDKIGDLVLKIVEYEHMANQNIDEYIDKKNEAVELVNLLDNATYIEILKMRYFEEATFEEIAVCIDKCWRHTIRLHGYALQEFQKELDKQQEICNMS